ncbi:bifunctional diguanylate cyclase/phosphodiesterase [Candidatus Clostridium stratigraminis]
MSAIFISDREDNIKLVHDEIQDSNLNTQYAVSKEQVKRLLSNANCSLILLDYETENIKCEDVITLRDEFCLLVPIIIVYKELEALEIVKFYKIGVNSFISISKLNSIENVIEDAFSDHKDKIHQKQVFKEETIDVIKSNIFDSEYGFIIEGIGDVIWNWDIESGSLHISDECKAKIGYDGKSGRTLLTYYKSLVHPADRRSLSQEMNKYLYEKGSIFQFEHRIKIITGEYKWLLIKGRASWNENGEPVRMHGYITDITEHKKTGEMVNYLAYYDKLTGLPNRIMFEYKLSSSLASLSFEDNDCKPGVLYFSIDDFNTINDAKGHGFGDKLIKKISGLLQGVLNNDCILSRIAGNEFAVLLQHLHDAKDVPDTAEKIMTLFKEEIIIDNFSLNVSISMGIALYPEDGENEKILLKNAHTALNFAKRLGRCNYQFYRAYMNDKIMQKLSLENKLREAVKNDRFAVYYQPQINIETGDIMGMEALVRWIHPTAGVISPIEFIPLAEETGLIVQIGEYVLRKACLQNKLWQKKGYPCKRIAVNISARQLKDLNFVDTIKQILEETGLEPKWLEIEITESMIIEDMNLVLEIIQSLRKMGICIALDDFGTGYSSLNYLTNLPIDTLKIDKSFIDKIHTGYNEQAVTKAIIGLAHNINLEIVAEGVENNEQLKLLKDYGCDKVQGYLFSKPLPAVDFESLLAV